jgi:hypothetical protein
MDTIAKTVVLYDRQGRIIKDLKPGMTASVRIQSIPVYRVQENQFSNINNKK